MKSFILIILFIFSIIVSISLSDYRFPHWELSVPLVYVVSHRLPESLILLTFLIFVNSIFSITSPWILGMLYGGWIVLIHWVFTIFENNWFTQACVASGLLAGFQLLFIWGSWAEIPLLLIHLIVNTIWFGFLLYYWYKSHWYEYLSQ